MVVGCVCILFSRYTGKCIRGLLEVEGSEQTYNTSGCSLRDTKVTVLQSRLEVEGS